MLKKLAILTVILLIVTGNQVISAGKYSAFQKTQEWLYYSPLSDLRTTYALGSISRPEPTPPQLVQDTSKVFHYPLVKSPKRALFMSVLVPGMGEFYTKSYIQSAAFLCAEVALWIGYASFRKDGLELEDKFEAFADENWIRDKYLI